MKHTPSWLPVLVLGGAVLGPAVFMVVRAVRELHARMGESGRAAGRVVKAGFTGLLVGAVCVLTVRYVPVWGIVVIGLFLAIVIVVFIVSRLSQPLVVQHQWDKEREDDRG